MIVIILGLLSIISIAICQGTPALLLTPLITTNRIQEARNMSAVDPAHFLNVTSHSGFLTVDERYNSNMFFWYFPVADKPVNETPWIIWLQGGPGATSLAGVFDEIGPFQYNNGLKLREYTWAKTYSMLFIDNPIGAGYSFTDSEDGFIKDMPTCASHLYKFLRQFLVIFPELHKAPLYIAGESYAGRYLPEFGLKILEQDSDIGPLEVNLKGIMMGNPVLNRDIIADFTSIFYQWGLIDTQGMLAAKPLQDAYTKAIQDKDADTAYELREKLLNKLGDMPMQLQLYNVLTDGLDDKLKNFMEYIKNPLVREAMHVGDITFTFSNETVHTKLKADFLRDVTSKLETLLNHYRILIYCGQLDMMAPCVPNAEARRKNWHWSHRDDFLKSPRTPWWYNNSIAGYVKSGGGFTEVLVRGSGHLVPMDKPAQVLNLITSFISGLDMDLPPNYQINANDTPDYKEITTPYFGVTTSRTGLIISIFINVILVLGIIGGVVYCVRWKRRTEAFLYNTVDESSITDGVLTMT